MARQAQDAGQELPAEAEAQDRYIRVHGPAQQPVLALHERHVIVERGELRAQRDDQVVLGGVDVAVLQVDPELLDVGPMFVQPPADQPRSCRPTSSSPLSARLIGWRLHRAKVDAIGGRQVIEALRDAP